MKLSPYGFDIGRIVKLATRPNVTFDHLDAPDDSVFPDDGLYRLPGAVSPDLCDQAIREYDEFERFRDSTNCVVRDENGRNYRLANFHLKSNALLKAGLQDSFHKPASEFFRRSSTIYTSLCYKHGSQQKAHLDTPFFWTRPFNLYLGVWLALEDVAPDAGPLFFYPGSHRLFASEGRLRDLYYKAKGDVQTMFDLMRNEVEKTIKPETVLIKKGDVVMWHPGIMHGGSRSSNPKATRYSMVYHFAPLGVNVRDNIFPKNFWNIPTYGVNKRYGNYYCRGKLPTIMI